MPHFHFLQFGDTNKGINVEHILTWHDGTTTKWFFPQDGGSYEAIVPCLGLELATTESIDREVSGPVSRRYEGAERLALLAWLQAHAERLVMPAEPPPPPRPVPEAEATAREDLPF